MRSLGEISHRAPESCKISLFAWNGKFIVKFEQGPCEQVYKFDQFEIESEEAVRKIASGPLLDSALERFTQMQADRMNSMG